MQSLGFLLDGNDALGALGELIIAAWAMVAIYVVFLIAIVVQLSNGPMNGPEAPSGLVKTGAALFALSSLCLLGEYFLIPSLFAPALFLASLMFLCVAAVCAYRGEGRARMVTLVGAVTIVSLWGIGFVWIVSS